MPVRKEILDLEGNWDEVWKV